MCYINLSLPLSNWYILQRRGDKVNPLCNIKAATVVTLHIYVSAIMVHHTTLIQITCNEDTGHISSILGQVRNQAIVSVICYLIDMQSFLKLSSAVVVDIGFS